MNISLLVILPYYYITILLYYYITILLYYYITILLYYYITILLYYYYYITTSVRGCLRPSRGASTFSLCRSSEPQRYVPRFQPRVADFGMDASFEELQSAAEPQRIS